MNTEMLKELIKDIGQYEAHTKENEKKEIIERESLEAHIYLTAHYFETLWNEKGMSEVLERFVNQICTEISKEAIHFLEEMVIGIPLFHDMGKINPEFQNKVMRNIHVQNHQEFACAGSRHSLISSVLYIDYYLEELKNTGIDRKERKFLRTIIIYHAYLIARHHSDLGEFEAYLNVLEGGQGVSIMKVFQSKQCDAYQRKFSLNEEKIKDIVRGIRRAKENEHRKEENIAWYVYGKLMYSLLVASDYYATTEFMTGMKVTQLGDLDEIDKWINIYENTELMKKIRGYQKEGYPKESELLDKERNINVLRTEMLLDAETVLKKNVDETMFYLEAPTGSGKSNTAIDLSFQLMKADRHLKKLYYIYPFNTLVEQNVKNLEKVFGNHPDIFESIAVINSLTPIKMTEKEKKREAESEQSGFYQKALLDRQFLNYPMIVSTHVSLFDTMFGETKESAFGFHQLVNSVVVLDEIQSYKNTLWGEIICFLKEISYLLNMKIIIMSATLPNLDLLSEYTYPAVKLMENTEKYFSNACFKNRVHISYELLKKENVEEELIEHIVRNSAERKKILVEFINKDSAYTFFNKLNMHEQIHCEVELMSGDDSLVERSRILDKIGMAQKGIVLVATQVIEAGVDIDMDIGYKNISKLDSEEQFLGRINRSCMKNGIVYFFNLDNAKRIYGEDVRAEREFTLANPTMQGLLIQKDYYTYYKKILGVLKNNYNEQVGEKGLDTFFKNMVGKLKYPQVSERMRLISEDRLSMSVFLSGSLEDGKGNIIYGRKVWEDYKRLLNDFQMNYPEKKVRLSEVKSKMNNFIYQIKRNPDLIYDDKIGEIIYIEDGEKYFDNGKLDRKKIQGEIGEFVDFI